jgi:DNA-binding MarR family transcriptional regulator
MLISSMMSRDLEDGLNAYGLTQARAHVIWDLSSGEVRTQRALADRLGVTPRNVTALVDALEQTGFVKRTAHPTDRRAIVVVLTEKGRETAARLQNDMTKFANDMFGDVAPSDLDSFLRLLNRTSQRLADLIAADGAK